MTERFVFSTIEVRWIAKGKFVVDQTVIPFGLGSQIMTNITLLNIPVTVISSMLFLVIHFRWYSLLFVFADLVLSIILAIFLFVALFKDTYGYGAAALPIAVGISLFLVTGFNSIVACGVFILHTCKNRGNPIDWLGWTVVLTSTFYIGTIGLMIWPTVRESMAK